MAKTKTPIDEVAEAIYNSQVELACQHVKNINIDVKELPELFKRLRLESETAQILICSSYLEDKVVDLIKAHLLNLNKAREDEIFGSNGPLNSFGNRISLSYHLGWLSLSQKTKLDAFRKIRNEFAHKAFKAKLSDPKIAGLFAAIDYDVRSFISVIRNAPTEDGERVDIITDNDITKESLILCTMVLLIMHTYLEYLLLPVAVSYNISPADLKKAFDYGDNPVMNLNRSVAQTFLELLSRN